MHPGTAPLRMTFGMDRRTILLGMAGASAVIWLQRRVFAGAAAAAPTRKGSEIVKTDAEWKAQLSPEQYAVLRKQGTEPPFTSPLLDEHRRGKFACAGCGLPLFSSAAKFDSGTGWPSFYEPLEDAVTTSTDYKLILPRTEVRCRRCSGHLGHVFDDGPEPTGLRYCMNGVALTFHLEGAGQTQKAQRAT